MVDRVELGKTLNLELDFIPESNSNRPGTKIKPEYITIHNTDNTGRGAGALAHSKYMKGTDAQRRKVSWHYTVDISFVSSTCLLMKWAGTQQVQQAIRKVLPLKFA